METKSWVGTYARQNVAKPVRSEVMLIAFAVDRLAQQMSIRD